MKALDELKKAFLKTGAKVTSFDIPYEVGLSMTTEKDKWESSGAKPVMRAFVPEGADSEEVYRAGYAYLGALVKETAGEQMKKIIAHRKKAVGQATQLHVPPLDEVDEIPFRLETRTPTNDAGEEICLIDVESLTPEHYGESAKRAKIRGKTRDYPSETWPYKGNYTKHGVVVYPEVLKEAGIDLDDYDVGRTYPMQLGYTAVVQIVDDKPKKIIAFV